MADASGKFFDDLRVTGVPKSKIETVNYKGAGYCVFMQGSSPRWSKFYIHAIASLAARVRISGGAQVSGKFCYLKIGPIKDPDSALRKATGLQSHWSARAEESEAPWHCPRNDSKTQDISIL